MAPLSQTIDLVNATAAIDPLCTVPAPVACTFPPATDAVTLRATGERSDTAPSFDTPRSALFHLDPSDPVVARVHLKQLARAALEFPESADWLKTHAEDWWCEMFHGQREGPPEACYVGRDAEFEAEWQGLMCADPSTFETTIGTLYRDASDAGWPGLTTRELHTKQESVDSWQELRDLRMQAIDQLVEEVAAGDAEAPFDELYLEALAYLNDDDPFTYAHIKAKLQRCNPLVTPTAIDAAIASYPYEPLLPPLRVNAYRARSELLAKVGAAAQLPGRHGAPLDGEETQHRAVVDAYLQRVKNGDLVGLDSEEFLVAICHIFFDDSQLFRNFGRQFSAIQTTLWAAVESYVTGYEASLQFDDLRAHADGHKAQLQAIETYYSEGGKLPGEDWTANLAGNFLAFFHPVEYLRVAKAHDKAIAEACRAALDAEWTKAEA